MGWLKHDVLVLRIELGPRALLHLQSHQRDLRWFRGLFR